MAVMSQAEASAQPLETPRPGRYRISPERSTVTIRTRHLFGLGPVRAALELRDGTISVADPVTGSVVSARAAVSTFTSGNQARDAAVLSRSLLHAEAHPSLTFTSTGLTSQAGEWVLRGELEARGVTAPVEARVTGASVADGGGAGGQDAFRVTARLSVDRYAFGITGYRGLAARHLTVDLDLFAESAGQSQDNTTKQDKQERTNRS
jgi:polyisoprenoid-binding protein YceI